MANFDEKTPRHFERLGRTLKKETRNENEVFGYARNDTNK